MSDCGCNTVITKQGEKGDKGDRGITGGEGNYTVLTAEPSGVNCPGPNGGTKIETFDGTTNVLISTAYACNGVVGPPGADGIDGTNGTNGTNGIDGANGINGDDGNYTVTTVEPAGVNCANGGVKIELFDGVTDLIIGTASYACNGVEAPLVWNELAPYMTPQWTAGPIARYAIDPIKKILYLKGTVFSVLITVDVTKIPFIIPGIDVSAIGFTMGYDSLNDISQGLNFLPPGGPAGFYFYFGLVTALGSSTLSLNSIPPIHLNNA